MPPWWCWLVVLLCYLDAIVMLMVVIIFYADHDVRDGFSRSVRRKKDRDPQESNGRRTGGSTTCVLFIQKGSSEHFYVQVKSVKLGVAIKYKIQMYQYTSYKMKTHSNWLVKKCRVSSHWDGLFIVSQALQMHKGVRPVSLHRNKIQVTSEIPAIAS